MKRGSHIPEEGGSYAENEFRVSISNIIPNAVISSTVIFFVIFDALLAPCGPAPGACASHFENSWFDMNHFFFLPEINLKSNPISDRRFMKLINQCGTKQIIDYVKQNCPRSTTDKPCNGTNKKGSSHKKKTSDENDDDDDQIDTKYSINIKPASDDFKV